MATLFDKIKGVFYTPDKNNELNKALFKLFGGGYGNQETNYKTYNDFIEQGYKLNPHIYSVINYITQSIKKIPFKVYEVVDEKSFNRSLAYKKSRETERSSYYQEKALKEVTDQTLIAILNNPNEQQTFNEFIEQSIGYKLLTGNNYIYGLKPTGFNNITKLYNIPSQLVSIKIGTWMDPIKGYDIGLDSVVMTLSPEDVLHRKCFNPTFNEETLNVYGLSPMCSLKNVVLRTNQAKKASLGMFQNGIPAGILSNESGLSMTNEELQAMQGQFKKSFGGGENANKILFSSQKLGWQSLGMSSVDLQIIEAEKSDLRDVCRVYGVPSVLMSDNDNSTYNNITEAERRFWINTAIPEIESFISDLNRFLFANYDKKYVIDYDVKAIPALQDDLDKISERLLKELEHGMWTPNDVRMMLDKPQGDSEHLNRYYLTTGVNEMINKIDV